MGPKSHAQYETLDLPKKNEYLFIWGFFLGGGVLFALILESIQDTAVQYRAGFSLESFAFFSSIFVAFSLQPNSGDTIECMNAVGRFLSSRHSLYINYLNGLHPSSHPQPLLCI